MNLSSLCATRAGVAGVALALLTASPAARADTPNCADVSGGAPIIYGAGGSAQRDLVGKIAIQLEEADDPIWVVYKDDAGACSGINALTGLAGTTISGPAYYWDPAVGTKATCNLDVTGVDVDFGVMGNSALLCPLVTDESLLEDIIDVTGPISTVNVIVPNASSQSVISAEAFYLIYGFGPEADIAPWNNADPAYYLRRNENSFVQIYLSLATGLPVTKFYGTDAGTNANSVSLVAALAEPEQGISFCSGDVADANRATVKTLAWQQIGQSVGYWPDSTATAYDKVNVRSGQYHLWGYAHAFGLLNSAGGYEDPNVGVFLEYFSGQSQPAGVTSSITEVAANNKNIPTCAMNVARDTDLGPVYTYAPEEPCGCFYDAVATGASTCETCDDSNPCAEGTCRFGYCEAR